MVALSAHAPQVRLSDIGEPLSDVTRRQTVQLSALAS
jgi:hypothetical protein